MQIEYRLKGSPVRAITAGIVLLMDLLFSILCVLNFKGFPVIPTLMAVHVAIFGIHIRVSKPIPTLILHGLLLLGLAIGYLVLARYLVEETISTLGRVRLVLNIMVFVVFAAFFYLITGKRLSAGFCAFTLLLLFEIINYQITEFRFNEIAPSDLLSLRTAFAVAGRYKPAWSKEILCAISIWATVLWFLIFGFSFPEEKSRRIAALAIILIASGILYLGLPRVTVSHWNNKGTKTNGFPVNFLRGLYELYIQTPEDYTTEHLNMLSEQYPTDENAPVFLPNIIVVMNESFADLRVLGDDLFTDQEVLPNLSSLKGNIIKGYALSSVYGGSTPNSEWEFLTGNTLAFLPGGAIPFQTYIQPTNNSSLVSNLKSLGYYCLAMHPYRPYGWSRHTVYPKLGFDEIHFEEDFPQKDTLRSYVTDLELYQEIIHKFEQRNPAEPLFLYTVSMQNHGDYDYHGADYQQTIQLEEPCHDNADVAQYLSVLHRSDADLPFLLSYFEKVPENTVIVFFGDHQPRLDDEYLETVHGGEFEVLSEQEQKYTIPFFIWANYDIETKEIPCTSLNYLSTYLYDIAGLPETGYIRFLKEAQKVIPAINSLGYYSIQQKEYLPFEEAESTEADWLNTYRILQYNNVFDHKNKISIFDSTN